MAETKKKLRVGIIGTGGIAHAHARAYKNFDDVEIVAGADIIPGKARAFLDEFGWTEATAYETHEELRAGCCRYRWIQRRCPYGRTVLRGFRKR